MRVDPAPAEIGPLLDEVERSTARFSAALERLEAGQLDAPSLLAGWSRRTLAAHLAHVALAYRRMTADALAGRAAATYPQGRPERERSLHSLDHVVAADLADHVRRAGTELLTLWRGLDRADWARPLHGEPVGPMALSRLLALRLTELEVHHADLGTGYTNLSWPERFVSTCLPLRIGWLGAHHRSRADADLDVSGRWLLRASDLDRSWLVEAYGSTAYCSEAGLGDGGDAVLTGPAVDLLAFLLGRAPSRPLELARDVQLALAFKRAFPGP